MLSSELRILENFRHLTPGAQRQVFSSTVRDPKASGPLVAAMRRILLTPPIRGD